MRLTVLSFFRDAAGQQVRRFIEQASSLHNQWQGPVRVVAVYGDCVDATFDQLMHDAHVFDVALHAINYDTRGPRYGSTEQPERLAALSGLVNAGLDAVTKLFETDVLERVFYVESDLIWDAPTVVKLGERFNDRTDAIAPLVFAGPHFYDVWGFRGVDNERFGPFEPYHSTLHPTNLTQVNSCGSCFMAEKAVIENVRIDDNYALVGFWGAARRHGYSLYVDPTLKVRHPA